MILYLHGFASGPGSTKARHFARAFADRGIPIEIPALDEGDFAGLTISRQLALIERLLRDAPRPHLLIGSSMGGYLAALHAERHGVDAMVLMAPAVDFASRWEERLGASQLRTWREQGSLEVQHHALGRPASIGYALVEDASVHSPWPRVDCPVLVLHGRRDEVVPQPRVERWVELNPTARLVLFDSGHELTDCMPALTQETFTFLAGVPALTAAWPSLR